MPTNQKLTELTLELRAYCEVNELPDDEIRLIVFNSAFHRPGSLEIPPELFSYLKRNGPIVYISIRESLLTLPVNFATTDRQKEDFKRGVPVLLSGRTYLSIDERNRGGQSFEEIERDIGSALEHITHAMIEKLVECKKAGEGKNRRRTAAARRKEVIKEIATKFIKFSSEAPSEPKECISLLTTYHSDSPKRGYIAYYNTENLKADIKSWASELLRLSEHERQDEIDFHLLQISSLLLCKKRAEQLRLAKGNEAKAIAKGEAESRSRYVEIAGTHAVIHRDVLDLLPAAFAGDFNPIDLFQVHDGSIDHLKTLQKLGKLARGRTNVEFSINESRILDDMLDIVERYREPTWQGDENQTKEAAFWHRALIASMPLQLWYRQLHATSNQPFLMRN